MNINNNLKKLRTEAGLTQEQVAEKLNVTRQALSSYESGRTRPDIDTLVRLAGIYDTDVNSIIYGPEDSTVTEGIKKAAHFLAVLLIVLTALRSALALCSNTFFRVDAEAPDFKTILEKHFAISRAWETADSLTLTVSFVGFLIIFYMFTTKRCRVNFETKAKYMVILAACLFIPSILMSLADPVFSLVDYIITPFCVIVHMFIFFLLDIIVYFVQKNRTA